LLAAAYDRGDAALDRAGTKQQPQRRPNGGADHGNGAAK
jgi:hypothetical protein